MTLSVQYLPNAISASIHSVIAHESANVLIIVSELEIEQLASTLQFFLPSRKILTFTAYDVAPYKKLSPGNKCIASRISTLAALCENKDGLVVIASHEALLTKLPPKQKLQKLIISLHRNGNNSKDEIINILVDMGYSRFMNAANPGEFASRGSILDIVSLEDGLGYRIDFFGNKIESIKIYDPQTQLSLNVASSCKVVPSSEIIFDDYSVALFTENVQHRFGLNKQDLVEKVKLKIKFPGIENFLPLFYEETSSLLDYINDSWKVIAKDTIEHDLDAWAAHLDEMYQESIKFKSKDDVFISAADLYNTSRDVTPKEYLAISTSNYKGQVVSAHKSYASESKVVEKSPIQLLIEDQNKGELKFVICALTKGSAERIKKLLEDYDFYAEIANAYDQLKVGMQIIVLPFKHNFQYKDLIFIAEEDLIGKRLYQSSNQKRQDNKSIFFELTSFKEDEVVVHAEHGIARFAGLETLSVRNIMHDFVKLIYKDNDKYYLPVENLELLTKYGGSDEVELDKLGSASWQARKARLRNRIKIAAEYLLKIAAERNVATKDEQICDSSLYQAFCDTFEYIETDDQLNAIADVMGDLASTKPMDRLVCGDVGFGKTEVALRAAFLSLATSHKSQVAILVPTTLLCRQHYATFIKRFAQFNFNIKQLSKFTDRKDIKQIKAGIADGSVDIIIGTHALLAKDVKFKSLGLIIIDEEQHFGVGQKERLKEIKHNCNILTLSATPIPRTLQQSLAGIKDLSIIATPPSERLLIKTHVFPFDRVTVREAIMREYFRDGRVFYVTPRISYIDDIVKMLSEIVPEVKVRIGHGQMSAAALDELMNDFYDGKFHVLVSTTIVESGLDIPSANTIIIDRAHMFGLSQLYQIRGRVGRSNTQAFAYITYPYGVRLNPLSEQKLNVLQSLDSLGAGFNIASHDMDMRGYGNLVGDEQSGHIKEVGVELYQKMLEDAVLSLKEHDDERAFKDDWSPELNLALEVHIPEEFVPDSALRISLYRRIASLDTNDAVDNMRVELVDRFGSLPKSLDTLLDLIKLKIFAKNLNISRVDQGDKGFVLAFYKNQPSNPSKVLDYISRNPLHAKLKDGHKLLVLNDNITSENVLHHLYAIFSSIS